MPAETERTKIHTQMGHMYIYREGSSESSSGCQDVSFGASVPADVE
jgi:hypothetical protein